MNMMVFAALLFAVVFIVICFLKNSKTRLLTIKLIGLFQIEIKKE